jgi:hypothetical protein
VRQVDANDEYLHHLGDEATFNESMYANLYDPARRLGGFFRMGNRPNEGTGEMTACLYLPDGRVAFMFRRPEITTNDALVGAGMAFDVLEPFAHLRVSYDGPVVVLDEPLEMADPKRAFRANPKASCQVALDIESVAPPVGGERDEPEQPGEEFARGHYEVLISGTGSVSVGHERFSVAGWGLRDHSWGPRSWQAPLYYRWLTGNAGDDFGFMATRIARRGSGGVRGGFVYQDGTLHPCGDCRITTTWTSPDLLHAAIGVELASSDTTWHISGVVQRLIPLRNRRQHPDGTPMVTRISEGLTEWSIEGRGVGYGMSEYLDQMIDGRPAGAEE